MCERTRGRRRQDDGEVELRELLYSQWRTGRNIFIQGLESYFLKVTRCKKVTYYRYSFLEERRVVSIFIAFLTKWQRK